jgi:hypothetical protein
MDSGRKSHFVRRESAMRKGILILATAAVGLWLMVPASAAASAMPTSVTIHTLRSDTDAWFATGAITDAGTFVDPTEFFAGSSSTFHATRVFTGDDGTITTVANVRILASSDPDVGFFVVGTWAITSGTGAYANVHGQGAINEELVAPGLVGTWTGTIVFAP